MKHKKGQVTIFVLISILIVAIVLAIFFLFPRIVTTYGFEEENPSSFIQSCINDRLMEGLEIVSTQGGSLEPQHYILYDGEKIEYLCYTNEYYKMCVMQQPMLKNHIESELESYISDVSDSCFVDLEKAYVNRNYNVDLRKGSYNVELLPNKVQVIYNSSLTLEKEDTKVYENIIVDFNNNLYELVSVANSILNFEAHYGDSETTIYMNYYRDLKVEKKKQSDGSTIYGLTETDTGNKFNFASRSLAWPAGYSR